MDGRWSKFPAARFQLHDSTSVDVLILSTQSSLTPRPSCRPAISSQTASCLLQDLRRRRRRVVGPTSCPRTTAIPAQLSIPRRCLMPCHAMHTAPAVLVILTSRGSHFDVIGLRVERQLVDNSGQFVPCAGRGADSESPGFWISPGGWGVYGIFGPGEGECGGLSAIP